MDYARYTDIGEHPLTGEINSEVYKGSSSCTRRNLPWYYQEVTDEEIKDYCKENRGTEYCRMKSGPGSLAPLNP
jgi:hypothetical protein